MSRHPTLSRPTVAWWAWIAVAALLLKAAVPLLATASAQAQGKTLVEVCTVYGVATVALGGAAEAGSDAPVHAVVQHGGDHCTLSSLLAGAIPPPMAMAMPVPLHLAVAIALPVGASCAGDACARWQAGLKQGPPRTA
jgi:hypothetical protein